MNNIVLTGRLTTEPELKTTASGVECMSFSLAVDRQFKDKEGNKITDFIPCQAWQKTAVFIDKYFGKGDGITLSGRMESRKYTDKEGNNRTAYYVNTEHVEFPLSKKSDNGQAKPDLNELNDKLNAAGFTSTANDDLPF